MCGRARCTLGSQQVARACGIDPGDGAASPQSLQMDRYRPSYNVSPGAYLPVVRKERAAAGGDRPAVIHCMKWGLVPGFTNKSEKPDHFRMFNARSESVREKASFRRLLPANRCLVAVEGFYEWKKDGSKKQPYYIHFKDGRPLVFAALYDSWRNPEGETLYTFTILTTRCSSSLEWLHDRMPVILGNKLSIDVWVNDSVPKYDMVLVPYEDPDLVWYPVSRAMGKPSFDGPECIQEIQLKPAAENSISKFFIKTSNKGHSQLQFLSSSAEYPLKEEPGTDEGQELTKMEKHGNADVLQTLKEESSQDEPPLGSLREEPSPKEPEEFYREMNIDYSGGFVPPKKETAETNICSIKREFEEIESNTGLTGNSLLLTPQGKKLRNIKNSGDKQATILSYFGRR